MTPPEAITAVAEVLHDLDCRDAPTTSCARWGQPGHEELYRAEAAAVLRNAAPPIAAAERDRIRCYLLDGDPGRCEQAFREFADPEEAADCALAVRDLLRDADYDQREA